MATITMGSGWKFKIEVKIMHLEELPIREWEKTKLTFRTCGHGSIPVWPTSVS